ncbi:Cytidylate kinase [termite gut metagenome]|uniref:(d)CMP kinase n=1 Tax=termite gut metagenome TaxID=433724 RepID=A0A5J4SZN6_9ZZZZ
MDTATRQPLTFLKGINVEEKIRTIEVSSKVSPVSTLEFVRKAMVAQQRKLGEEKGIVMDGRDIGTTVFPDAELKIFVTASLEIRAQRRYDELIAKGVKAEWEDILRNVKERDCIDQNRQISPLRKAADAILLDNSQMTPAEQKAWLWEQYRKVVQ